jgi:NADPH-dependent ferric siderophore reductase
MSDASKPERPTHELTVVGTELLTPSMVRVAFASDAIVAFPDSAVPGIGFTDTYVKLRFGDALRAYTLRSVDREAGQLAIDFVVHGDSGLAGPWAAAARPGDVLTCLSPGGEWAPRASADVHVLVGDEPALPAIGSSLDALIGSRPDARALVFAEVETAGHEYPLATGPGVDVRWIRRDGAPYGERLVEAVLAEPWPAGDVEAFVHGNAEMVRPVRRYLLREVGLPRTQLSVSGYWRAGHTDESWRASKREFNAIMEEE